MGIFIKTPEEYYQKGEKKCAAGNFYDGKKYYKKAAEAGHLQAQLQLAKQLEEDSTGWNEEAFYWYGKAAEQGDPEAQYQYARLLPNKSKSDGITRMLWFEKAAEQGHVNAQYRCAEAYRTGNMIEENIEKAIYWHKKLAEQGNADSQNRLGMLYDAGKGIPQNKAEAFKWFRMAAEQGYKYGQYNLSRMYSESNPPEHKKAFEWMKLAAEQGLKDAQYECGKMYLDGIGTAKDIDQSLIWLEKAANQGNKKAEELIPMIKKDAPLARLREGTDYFYAENYTKALPLLQNAADAGYIQAFLFLAMVYRFGSGNIKAEPGQAQYWFHRWIHSVEPGTCIKFGSFPQFFTDSEKEWDKNYRQESRKDKLSPVVWRVLKVQANRVLLLSEKGLLFSENNEQGLKDLQKYGGLFSKMDISWVKSELMSLDKVQYDRYLKTGIAPQEIQSSVFAILEEARKEHLDATYDTKTCKVAIRFQIYPGSRDGAHDLLEDPVAWWLNDGSARYEYSSKRVSALISVRPAVWIGMDE